MQCSASLLFAKDRESPSSTRQLKRANRQPSLSWKAVWIPGKDAKWSLYNLASDAGETRDLADDEPDRLTEMVRLWRDYEAETGVVRLDPDQAFALKGYGFAKGLE